MFRKVILVMVLAAVLSGCAVNAIEPVIQTLEAQPAEVFIPPVPLAECAEWCAGLEGNDRFTDEALNKCGCPACDKVPSFGGLPAECDAKCR